LVGIGVLFLAIIMAILFLLAGVYKLIQVYIGDLWAFLFLIAAAVYFIIDYRRKKRRERKSLN